MGKRGRPPYPDVLTPREREVHALLRDGLSNEAIAGRLGISLAGAKYHVSEILSKLGVASREEAAAIEPQRRRWWLAALAPAGLLGNKASFAVAGLAAIAVAAGIGVLLWGLLRTDGGDDSALVAQPTFAPPQPVVLGEGLPGGVDWADGGTMVAFVQGGSLHVARAPDFSPTEILPYGGEYGMISAPRISPDGTRIAFVGTHPGRTGNADPTLTTGTIWLVNTAGTGFRDLIPDTILSTSTGKVMQGWLDNETIAFDEHCGTGCQQPYLLDVTTGEIRPVLRDDPSTGGAPGTVYYYSPDERHIAIDAQGTNPLVALYGRSAQDLTWLTDYAARGRPWQWFDAWAPDSSRFLYDQAESDGTNFAPPIELYEYNVTTGESRRIAQGKDGAYSRDGSMIAYVTAATNDRPCGGAQDCVAAIDSASGEELWRVPGPGTGILDGQDDAFQHPWFLPDGRVLYNDFDGNVWVASDGSRSLLRAGDSILELHLSPQGDRVVVVSVGTMELVTIPAEGAVATPQPNEALRTIVRAIETGDRETLQALIEFTTFPCTTDPRIQPSYPPLCPEGLPDGSLIQRFVSGSCEFGSIGPEGIGRIPDLIAGKTVYGVYPSEFADEYQSQTHAAIVYREGGTEYDIGVVGIDGDRIVSYTSDCGPANPAEWPSSLGLGDPIDLD